MEVSRGSFKSGLGSSYLLPDSTFCGRTPTSHTTASSRLVHRGSSTATVTAKETVGVQRVLSSDSSSEEEKAPCGDVSDDGPHIRSSLATTRTTAMEAWAGSSRPYHSLLRPSTGSSRPTTPFFVPTPPFFFRFGAEEEVGGTGGKEGTVEGRTEEEESIEGSIPHRLSPPAWEQRHCHSPLLPSPPLCRPFPPPGGA
jgi:hypothetical protein